MSETTEDKLELHGRPIDREAYDVAIRTFVRPMLRVYRLPLTDEDLRHAGRRYGLHLARFDGATLQKALEWFEANRKDPFMPTIAECIERCDLIYGKSDQAQMERAFSRLYPIGGGPREMWPLQLGPEPGKPGCRLSLDYQCNAWRERLQWFEDLALGKIGGVPRGFVPPQSPTTIGLSIYRQLLNEYDVDTTKPPHPIPLSVLLEFNVPTDMADVASRMELDAAERAAAVDQDNTRH